MREPAPAAASDGFSLNRVRAALRASFETNGPLWIILGLFLLHLLVYRGCVQPIQHAGMASRSKQNLHSIQLGLERFATDNNGSYPESTSALIRMGYFTELPINPFSGEPMREYRAGETPPPGDFVYLPQRENGEISSYLLGMGDQAAQLKEQEMAQ